MSIKYGMRSTLRAKGRSILFAALILLISLSLALGAGMWSYCGQLLEDLDENYSSLVLMEYMGADYPNEDAADSYARNAAAEIDVDAIAALEGVKLWEPNDRALGYIEGYVPGGDAPYKDYAIIEFVQFATSMKPGTVYLTEEELVGPCVAVNTVNNTAKVISDDVTSEWVPCFIENNGKYVQQDFETGAYTEFSEDELPEKNICRKHQYYEGAEPGVNGMLIYYYTENFDYYLYNDGERSYKLTDHTQSFNGKYEKQTICTFYTYDVEKGLYGGDGMVVAGYSAISNDILYARELGGKQNKYTTIEMGDSGFVAERGHRYILHGHYMTSETGFDLNFLITDFYEGCPIAPYQDVTTSEADPIFEEYAKFYKNANNNVAVEASDDIASLELFHQNVFKLEEGRFPNAGESGVCVVSGDIAKQLELQLGDSISLEIFNSAEGGRYDLSGKGDVRELQVVGITTRVDGYYGNVWVSSAEGGFNQPLFGYQLGRGVLDNASAAETVEQIQALCPDGVRVTLFDQGYGAAAQPIRTMLNTASAVTMTSVIAALAVVFLFAYLFVGRQKETVNVLVSLGTPSGKINSWLLSGAVLISGIASFVGAILGGAAIGKVIEMAMSASGAMYTVDSRYSESAIGIVRESVEAGKASAAPAVAAFIFVFVLSFILCWIFLRIARKTTAPKRGKVYVRLPKGKSSYSGKGALRFARLSAARGGWRSGVVPAVALIFSIFLGILATASAGWSQQADELYRNAEISGRTSSVNGRSSTNLTIPASTARRIWNSGYIDEVGMSIGFDYWMDGDMPSFGEGAFSAERRSNWISVQPDIVALNKLEAAPEFIHSRTPEIIWLEGWDESFLSDPDACGSITETMSFFQKNSILNAEKSPDTVACVAPNAFLESHGIKLGDELEANFIMSFDSELVELRRSFKVVGVFNQLGEDANLYVPLSFWCDEDWITGEEDMLASGEEPDVAFSDNEARDDYFYNATRFSTFVFTLSGASYLEDMRDFLAKEGFSQVGQIGKERTTIVLYDRNFVETLSGLNRYVSFSRLLFPALFVLVAVLGFIVSWLMVSTRRMEFAIMRGLGASKSRVFFSFFSEQALLCIAGTVLGCIVLCFMGGGAAWPAAVGVFVVCYLLGTVLSVLAVGRTKLMSLLSERE